MVPRHTGEIEGYGSFRVPANSDNIVRLAGGKLEVLGGAPQFLALAMHQSERDGLIVVAAHCTPLLLCCSSPTRHRQASSLRCAAEGRAPMAWHGGTGPMAGGG